MTTGQRAEPSGDVVPFHLDVARSDLDDLAERLRRTRWPAPSPAPDWAQGVPIDYLRELCEYWISGYDWRACEKRLNAVGQYRAEIGGVGVHLLHARSPHASALPLLLTHGWPGSVREFLDLVAPLTDPPDPADAFHVVAPSLPGFGFSDAPGETGWNVPRIAEAWAELMARLGYRRYGAHGGDWGSLVTARLGAVDAAHLAGIHLTIPVVDLSGTPTPEDELSEFERAGAARLAEYSATGTGYLVQQSTRPQTLGYGLADSPAGQLAWIVEKLYSWSDCRGHLENAISRDAVLDNVMLYWLPNAAATSARIYWESFPLPDDTVAVPAGCSIFPYEQVRVPRAAAERRLTGLRYWNEMPSGGHFPGLEQPDALVGELRAFFRPLR
jgi:pimeloyl-ACP methyl ester carboxylesterase